MSPDHAQKQLQVYKDAITLELEKVLSGAPKLFDVRLSQHSLEALEKLADYSLRPSKRVRGSLAAFAYDCAADTKFGSSGLRAGAALELAQSYLLIIDDVMDKSMLRRGEPTLHELYRKEQRDDEYVTDMMAISVGLVAQHVLNLVMTSIEEEPEQLLRSMRLLHRNICITGFGQLEDLYQSAFQRADEQEIVQKYIYKSSYYTFVNPIQVGLVLGGATDDRMLQEVEKIGEAAGVAFQLHDDILGVFGDSVKTGKSSFDDIKEGKYTMLLHHALSYGDKQTIQILRQAIGNPEITSRTMGRVRNVLQKTGSKEFVEEQALRYAQEAKELLADSAHWDGQAKSTLTALIDYSVTREV